MSSKFYIKTLGCQMNKNDSERIAGLLKNSGLLEVSNEKSADVLIINTCSVRKQAEDRIFGIVKNWLKLKSHNPNLIVAITGCMPGRDISGKMRRKFSAVDLFFPIDNLPQLPKWLMELNPNLQINSQVLHNKDYLDILPERQNMVKGYVSIQTGCNNFCSYCIVPYARGRERNRSVKNILNEVSIFNNNGGLEITLLGQVVNHYIAPDPENFSKHNPYLGKDDFSALLWEVNQFEQIKRINFTASHPGFFNQAQISALSLPKQMNYLHLPVQSGDNEILKKMNRHYTREDYLSLVKKIREKNPTITIGTDLIVGFCTETEEQFLNTLDLYQQAELDIAYIAMYSPRQGTVAEKTYPDDVSRVDKKNRWERLQTLLENQAYQRNQIYLNMTVEVLVDSWVDGLCSGYSREFKLVQFLSNKNLTNQLVKVKIFEAKEWLLKGELSDE